MAKSTTRTARTTVRTLTTAEIQDQFISTYSLAALGKLDDGQLAKLLFADKNAGIASGTRGMFTWIEYGDPENGVPDNSWGSCGVFVRYGVWLGADGNYIHHDPSTGKHGITEAEAEMAAVTTRDIITRICDEVGKASLNTVADYRELDRKIAEICPRTNNYYWSKNGDLYIYLIKYLHMLYPEKIAECFSDSKLEDKLAAYGKHVPKSWHKIVKNGVVSLTERGLI